jgi:hypothetical protein
VKIFDNALYEPGWHSKVNFIDENNVVLGYDTHTSCCEDADWFISTKPENNIVDHFMISSEDLLDYRFCTTWYQLFEGDDGDYNFNFDGGGMAIFKIVNSLNDELFIHIYNHHNGYYGHGFEFKHGGSTLQEGTI